MKTLLSAAALLVFIGLLFFGCSDKTNQPVESSNGTLQKEGSGEGAGILRYEAENAYGFIDVDAHLLLVLGINDFPDFCSGGGGMEWFKFKELLLPNTDPELRRLIMQITARDVTAVIWQADSWPEDFCDFALNNQPLATGTANFKYTDNDFYAWWQEHPNRNPFGYKANGSLESLTGQKYNFNFFDRIIWDWDGSKFMENIKIHLIPKGN
ncbi:MAG TPA: hypothetical protein VLH59_15765 [Ignavibacteriaceae bacterium]|nr:hypothetical protein [Ignavibacteriaceae bacterium]